ncbi:Pentatricopeptide repeat-containing protein [Quillaja saponaria]|uniref:Pentatricopeptide repeat-containing protein n=1 Tax=Quillaja saponaria TaxID=32244 RepID=A0AAD7L7J3_QUISA|nr:Pentatricopeptide repeat-containing protein [Quillaja saponaria]
MTFLKLETLPLYLLYFRKTFTFSSQSQHNNPFLQTTSFKFNTRDSVVNRLCKEKKFNEAIDILCEQKRLREAVQLLDHIDRPSVSIYSMLIDLCHQHRALEEGRRVLAHIKASGFLPRVFIFNRFLNLYSKLGSLGEAQKIFDEMGIKDLCSWNTMLAGYAKTGQLDEARKLFDEMPERDNFSWTAIISGYVRHDKPEEALELYRIMQGRESSKSNKFTSSSALAASAAIPCLRFGKEIHGYIMRKGLESDEVVWGALLDMYGKCGSLEEARYIFDKLLDRDIVSWTTMIDGYFKGGRREEGFFLFSKLITSGIRPNEYTFAGVLNACANYAAEDLGKEVHAYMTRIGFNPFSFAVSSLVHMYSKCGNIENARRVFIEMPRPDLVSWTSLIVGYAQHGQSKEALQFFELLLQSGTQPDHVAFVGVLSACTHSGLVDKGLEYFYSIKEKHGLTHTADHYACIIDLLARSARFEEAKSIIDKMPIKPDKFLWASLLGGCRIHGNLEMAKRASEALFEIEPENPASYVTLANIYATAGMWSELAKVRKTMEARGIVKEPGRSWIEIKRQVHVFLVGDRSHPKSNDIYNFLSKLSKRMKGEGYVPDTNFVLYDVEEEQKEQKEKDTAIKYISKIVQRKIIVRDSNRFHCFEDGSCSCKDYW